MKAVRWQGLEASSLGKCLALPFPRRQRFLGRKPSEPQRGSARRKGEGPHRGLVSSRKRQRGSESDKDGRYIAMASRRRRYMLSNRIFLLVRKRKSQMRSQNRPLRPANRRGRQKSRLPTVSATIWLLWRSLTLELAMRHCDSRGKGTSGGFGPLFEAPWAPTHRAALLVPHVFNYPRGKRIDNKFRAFKNI